jgi:hypothetical protein
MKIRKNQSGYFFRESAEHGRSFIHRERLEKLIGQPIPPGFEVHHIDGDPSNNTLNNLSLVRPDDHQMIHDTADPNVRRELEEAGQRLIRTLRDRLLAENRSARRAVTAKTIVRHRPR